MAWASGPKPLVDNASSVVKWRVVWGSEALSTMATGVAAGLPPAINALAISRASCAAMYRATVSAFRAARSQSERDSPWPTRGVTNATERETPRCVSDTPNSALAASAAVMPGTIS